MFIMQSLIGLLFYPYAKYILKLHIFAAVCSVNTVYPENIVYFHMSDLHLPSVQYQGCLGEP